MDIKTALKVGVGKDARVEREILLQEVLNWRRIDLYLNRNRKLLDGQWSLLQRMMGMRKRGIPLAYLLGWTEFMGMKFLVGPSCFIPRPETELLVEEVIKSAQHYAGIIAEIPGQRPIIVDLGSGSGNIIISLARNLKNECLPWLFYGVDISQKALNLACKNAEIHQVHNLITFVQGDLFRPLKDLEGSIDIIVSNPPYVCSGYFPFLPPEVKREPAIALEAGEDGLYFIKRIIKESPLYLKEGGSLFLEIGFNQAESIKQMINCEASLSDIFACPQIIKDYQGRDRILKLKCIKANYRA